MFETPLDGVLAWVGLALVSLAVAGIAVSLPTTVPPDAAAVARQVDEVATSDHRVAASVPLRADAVSVQGSQLSLRDDGVTAHARLVAGDVVPADSDALGALLDGREPGAIFEDRAAFERALAAARERSGNWRPAPDRLQIRRVRWGDVDATVVG